ncbi:MAG: hypothetical protein Q4F41_19340 [Eubacteriales bacterium]|nr:hypothetical protein [Eubacteriales bacterium]
MNEKNIQRLEETILFVRNLAHGVHPVTLEPVMGDTLLNEPDMIRQLYTVVEILEAYRFFLAKKGRAARVPYAYRSLPPFEYTRDLPVTQFAAVLNQDVDTERMKKLPYTRITKWLEENGFLETIQDPRTGGNSKVATPAGCEIGIYMENRISARGPYQVVMYGRKAQEFLVEHLDEISVEKAEAEER